MTKEKNHCGGCYTCDGLWCHNRDKEVAEQEPILAQHRTRLEFLRSADRGEDRQASAPRRSVADMVLRIFRLR